MPVKSIALLALAVVAAFAAGMETTAWRTGNLIVQRNAAGECLAIDTTNAAALGTFPKRGDRCYLADWRMWHPL